MPHLSVADTMYRITAPDGTALWQGAALVGDILLVENTDSATITAGEAVRMDRTTLRLGHFNLAASATPPIVRLGVLRASGAITDINWVGVSMEPISVGKLGRVMGEGSICCVQSINPPTVNTAAALDIGVWVTGSATLAGKVNTVAAPVAGAAGTFPAGGTVLGTLIQIAGTTGPPTDTGTAGVIGIMVTKVG